MPPSAPSWTSVHQSERLADTPVVRRGGHWWLVSPAGTLLASDSTFNAELDCFAADMAAANRAVAELHAELTAASDPVVREARR